MNSFGISLIQFCTQVSHSADSSHYKNIYVVRKQEKSKLVSGQENAILHLLENPPVSMEYLYHHKKNVIYRALFEDPYSLSPEKRHTLYFQLELYSGQWQVTKIYDDDISNEVQRLAN